MDDERTSTLFGMAGFRVLAVDEHDGRETNVLVELGHAEAACPGSFSPSVKQRPWTPTTGYNAAVREALPHARITINKFHAIRLANKVVTAVRCRRQQQVTGHRGQ